MSKNIIGIKNGNYTVISLDEEKTKKEIERKAKGEIKRAKEFYIIQCKQCGKTRTVSKQKAVQGNLTCTCQQKGVEAHDLKKGMTFGKWTIIDKAQEHYGQPHYICKCECGTIKPVNGYNLVYGKTIDCGCGRKQVLSETTIKDLVGQKFGKLTVIGRKEDLKYVCQCECGSVVEVRGCSLVTGHTTSCGCTTSKYGEILQDVVLGMGYECKREYYVKINHKDLTYFRYDLYVPQLNLAIEYDGEGHYIPIDYGGKGKEWAEHQLKTRQYYDEIKNDYCKQNNVNLLRIPYWEKDNIELIIKNKIEELLTVND